MEYNFDKVMSEKSNVELIAIVSTDFSKYQLEAVESAKKELATRNIDEKEFKEISQKVIVEKEVQTVFDASMAGSGLRMVHFIVDLISFFIIYIILTSLVLHLFNIDSNTSVVTLWLLILISFFTNYAFMEYAFQKTLGKFITQTKVVNLNGGKPGLDDILVRTLCRLIPFDRLSFLFAKNGFHDGISNTRVTKDNPKPPNPRADFDHGL